MYGFIVFSAFFFLHRLQDSIPFLRQTKDRRSTVMLTIEMFRPGKGSSMLSCIETYNKIKSVPETTYKAYLSWKVSR